MSHMATPSEMQAIQVTEYNKSYTINNVPVPSDLGPLDLLVKVAVASNCHTDSMVLCGAFPGALPLTASHEGAGTIVTLGAAASSLGFSKGQRVMCGIILHPCGVCQECLGPEHQKQYCEKLEGYVGVTTHGCFAQYVKVDARSTNRIPDQVSFLSAAPLACAGRTVWRGVLQTGLVAGEWVAIMGSGGGLGHLGIQFAKAKGLNVIGIDARDEGLEMTKEHGADVVIDARQGKDFVVQQVQKVTGGNGADSTLCLTDHPDAASISCGVTKLHGVMVMIAQPEEISVPFREIVFRDIKIRGSLLCSSGESDSMLQTIAEHGIKVKTNRFDGLDSIEKLQDMVHSGKIKGKAVIVVDPEQMEQEKNIGAKY